LPVDPSVFHKLIHNICAASAGNLLDIGAASSANRFNFELKERRSQPTQKHTFLSRNAGRKSPVMHSATNGGAAVRQTFGILAAAALALSSLTGCEGMSRQQQRALSGGAIGAAGGAALGAIVGGSAVTGALIGGAGGAAVGALTK
jgi:hypothetical protein